MKSTASEKKIIELTEIITLKDNIAKTDESIIQSLKEQVRILKDINECNDRMDLYNKSVITSLKARLDSPKPNTNSFSYGMLLGAVLVIIFSVIIHLIFKI
jgi:hypothetical protein